MKEIFDLFRQGYRWRLQWSIDCQYDSAYEGYLIVFFDRPRIVWDKPDFICEVDEVDDEIPF